ncbi:MAG TPA: hypothetical protein VF782_11935 [Allosphingosinicella sp.]|jgi:hypothetical protein
MDAQVEAAGQKATPPEKKRIGLLFVHGIGEQARFEHLTGSVRELAELMLRAIPNSSVSVVDRTSGWTAAPGVPDPGGRAPMTLTLRTPDKHYEYECYEVWWADLGARSGIFDSITFWLWGLGQWAAPIYQELDGSQMTKLPVAEGTTRSRLVTLPSSVAGKLGEECLARFRLAMAAFAAAFIGSTWALAKRVVELLGKAPSPTLIVRYVGDVRTYEERARPGDSAISDPGQPRRVGIRRRMVSEMVTVASREVLDDWWILAHSQGTVLAYNGITEIGHALPNYLPEDQWTALDPRFKDDPECARRGKVHAMMPARPPWLDDDDVISRPFLFSKLRGFITYGSPLDKFAGLWPRIVGTATDRLDDQKPLAGCQWVNIASPQDPVAGMLCRFPAGPDERLEGAVPQVRNIAMPWRLNHGLAHIQYFAAAERWVESGLERTKRSVASWLAGGNVPPAAEAPSLWVRGLIVYLPYFLIIALVWLATSALIAVVLGLTKELFNWGSSEAGAKAAGEPWSFGRLWREGCEFLGETLSISGLVLDAALAIIIGFGLWRWYSESRLNVRLAKADAAADVNLADNGKYWDMLIEMLSRHRYAGLLFLAVSLPVVAAGIWIDWTHFSRGDTGFYGAAFSFLLLLLAILVQAGINGEYEPDEPGRDAGRDSRAATKPPAPATPPAT